MLVKIPVMLAQETELEDVQGEPHASFARVNPDHVSFYHYFTDTESLLGLSNGVELIACLTCDKLDKLLEQYEITVYEN